MSFHTVPKVLASIILLSAVLSTAMAADAREGIRPSSPASKADPRRPTGKVVLPDPTLLDGATHPAEKRPETGMIGEFELPGDENARTGKVGQQGAQQQEGEQQAQQQGGGGAPQTAQSQQEQGGGGGQQQQQQQGGPQGSGKQGQGDPNAKAEGIQVAGLQGEGGGNPEMANAQKPAQVSIGDSAMQIKTVANAPTVVGAQQNSGPSQQHEKATGTGGKQPTGNNSNRGAEKGRSMPAGL